MFVVGLICCWQRGKGTEVFRTGTLKTHDEPLRAVVPVLSCPVSSVLQAASSFALPLSLGFNLPFHVTAGSIRFQTMGWGTTEQATQTEQKGCLPVLGNSLGLSLASF